MNYYSVFWISKKNSIEKTWTYCCNVPKWNPRPSEHTYFVAYYECMPQHSIGKKRAHKFCEKTQLNWELFCMRPNQQSANPIASNQQRANAAYCTFALCTCIIAVYRLSFTQFHGFKEITKDSKNYANVSTIFLMFWCQWRISVYTSAFSIQPCLFEFSSVS